MQSKLYPDQINLNKISKEEESHINREIAIHKSFNHPNIVRMHNAFKIHSTLYIVLDYISRGSLFDFNKSNLSDGTIARIFAQIVSAIEFMHRHKILHRDIKPENVLIDEAEDARLCDFGFCAPFGENVLRKTMCGTQEYFPPEILNNAKQDEKVDIWCLGILLYELTHKKTPFAGKSSLVIVNEAKLQKISFKPGLNAEFRTIIQMCLNYDPKRRPSAEQLLAFPVLKRAPEPRDSIVRTIRFSEPGSAIPGPLPPIFHLSASGPTLPKFPPLPLNTTPRDLLFNPPGRESPFAKSKTPQNPVLASPIFHQPVQHTQNSQILHQASRPARSADIAPRPLQPASPVKAPEASQAQKRPLYRGLTPTPTIRPQVSPAKVYCPPPPPQNDPQNRLVTPRASTAKFFDDAALPAPKTALNQPPIRRSARSIDVSQEQRDFFLI